jgi:hypothetical protein
LHDARFFICHALVPFKEIGRVRPLFKLLA